MSVQKTLRIYRHSLKDGKNDSIGPLGIELARQVAKQTIDRVVTDIFIGPLPRTTQTVEAMQSAVPDFFSGVVTLKSIPNLGSKEMFTFLTEPKVAGKGFKELAERIGNLNALFTLHTPAAFDFLKSIVRQGVVNMFAEMIGNFAIGIFHSPTVELAAESFSIQLLLPPQFPEMSYVEFIKPEDDDFEILPKRHWICNIKVD
ncbi:MAG: hypothetical protein COY66_02780 [Candidatus Kerfeldbacteria bacterium CG_4_10_14_0_8_um_filter_42_10]|uniref:Histidine phosphatase family protein n=1 Tax=Candidatus Kerfeldbacteria bacterium CG_4_10_14_0_8_um_filter_42_10 TaxID=2014248 RepID=A0A2M7RJX6_9BACT|nr:MAG: hypothetical protein COY66_02780 [Candidatus Kerfeldbacteria bacterium CG_4_10_14_0_8_um_filter_42_10]